MSSKVYYRGFDFDDEPPSPEDFGYVKMDKIPDIDWIEKQLKKAIVSMYETGNTDDLEDSIDEIRSALKMKACVGSLKLTKIV